MPGLRASASARTGLHGKLKLARLLEMSEAEFEKSVRETEASPLFAQLLAQRVISIAPYAAAGFAARRFGGWSLRAAGDGIGDLLDGQGDLVALIQKAGRERFAEVFLSGESLSDAEAARACGLGVDQARRLRELVDRLYIRGEFETQAAEPSAPRTCSAVAGIEVEAGRPVIGFFNREIWKGGYRIDDARRIHLKQTLPPEQYRRLERFLGRLEFLERRKSTLYRVLEAVVEAQKEFLVTGEPSRRKPMTQRSLAADLDALPSTINRLISNKSVQLPWGLEAPLSAFVPSAKELLRDRLHDLALERPDLSDAALGEELGRLYGAALSRRSIAQYRHELGLPGRGKRR